MFDGVTSLHPLFEIGSVISLAALLVRDQIALRLALLLAHLLYTANNAMGGIAINVEFVAWNGLSILIDLYVLADIAYGRTMLCLSAEDRRLFGAIGGLAPGEFRRLMKLSVRRQAEVETAMTSEGSAPDKLFFVYEGAVTVLKAGRETRLLPRMFVGEIAFLGRGAASASVRVTPQSRWVEWPAPALRRQLDRDRQLRTALVNLIGEDLARKVARA